MTCGAAVRGRARFCPQCGQDMSEASTLNRPALVEEQTGTPSGRLVDEAERVARRTNGVRDVTNELRVEKSDASPSASPK